MQSPEIEDETTLFSLSTEYLEAATILQCTAPTKFNCSIVMFYLVGHAAELLLKSFLYRKGESIEDLRKKFGHDLAKLSDHARRKGLTQSVALEHIHGLSVIYDDKRTEYRKKIPIEFPPLDLLLEEVRELQRHVYNHVAPSFGQ